MAREYLANIDTTLLRLEDPTNPMMITVVATFKAPVDFERLKQTIQVRLLRMARFQQRVVWSRLGHGSPYWQDDPDFDLNYHVQRATLPPSGDQTALQEVVSLLASTPLDQSKPLWQVHLLHNYAECCALVGRFHHCIADGMALMHVFLSLTDAEPDTPWPVMEPAYQEEVKSDSVVSRLRARRKASQAMSDTLQQGRFGGLLDPSRAADLGRMSRDATIDLARFLFTRSDPQTSLRGKLSERKVAAWSDGISLDEIKLIRKNLGGTVNDVLLTAAAGALNRYLQSRGEAGFCLDLRVAVPMNLRPAGTESDLGNRMGAVFLALPVGASEAGDRLQEIGRRMDDRKGSLEGPVFFVLLNALGWVPAGLAKTLVNTFGTRATAVMTNVKGPQEQLYLAGAAMETLVAWVPQTGPIGVGLSILSYDGCVVVGLLTDESLVPDPEAIVAAFQDEFEALKALAGAAEEEPAESEVSALLEHADATLDEIMPSDSEVVGPAPA